MADIDYSKIPTEDLKLLQSGDISKVSTPTLQYLKDPSTGYPEAEKKGISRFVPEGMMDVARGAKEAVAEALPIVGGLTGAALSSPGLATTVVGAGLGTAAGEAGKRFLTGDKWRGIPQEAVRTGKDVITGAGMEMGGAVAGKGLQMAMEKAFPLAQKLYGYAIHTPVTEKWKKLYPGAEGTAREAAVTAGFKDGIVPNKFGLQMATARASEVTDNISGVVNRLTGTMNIPATSITGPATKEMMGRAWASGDSEVAGKTVRGIMEGVSKKAGTKSAFTPDEVLSIKRQFDSEIAWDKANPIVDVKGQFTREAKMAIRDQCMKVLENVAPELKHLNKKAAAYIDLKEAIEHTLAKESSIDGGKALASKFLAIKSIALGVLDTTLGFSTNRARLAFALQKGAQEELKNTMRVAAYGGISAAKSEDTGNNTVIRYDSTGKRISQ